MDASGLDPIDQNSVRCGLETEYRVKQSVMRLHHRALCSMHTTRWCARWTHGCLSKAYRRQTLAVVATPMVGYTPAVTRGVPNPRRVRVTTPNPTPPRRADGLHHDMIDTDLQPPRGRTSWGAVVAGAVIAMVVMVVLQTAMLWLGFSAVDPLSETNPFDGLGTGAAIGYLVAAALSLFVGGLVTGRLANRVSGTDVFLHGLLTWAVVTLATLFIGLTTVGTLLTGTLGALGTATSALGSGAAAVAPDVAGEVEAVIEEQSSQLEAIQEEMADLWEDQAARNEFHTAVQRIFRDGESTVSEADRDELVDVVATNTELSEAEAEARVDGWVETYEAAQVRLEEAEQELREAGQAAADALAQAAMWALLGMIVGAIVTWLGARSGAPSSRAETARA